MGETLPDKVDVVIVGSGAAALTGAVAARHAGLGAIVVEKAACWGGTSAWSGGGVWIPNNEVLKRDGVTDTPEAARTYLHGIVGDAVAPERVAALVEARHVDDALGQAGPIDAREHVVRQRAAADCNNAVDARVTEQQAQALATDQPGGAEQRDGERHAGDATSGSTPAPLPRTRACPHPKVRPARPPSRGGSCA